MVSVNLTLTTSFGPVEGPKCLHSCMQYWSGYRVDSDPKTRYTPGAFVNKTARYSGMRGKAWVGASALPWHVPQNALVSRRDAIVFKSFRSCLFYASLRDSSDMCDNSDMCAKIEFNNLVLVFLRPPLRQLRYVRY